MGNPFLTDEEIQTLTARVRVKAQARQLQTMKIPHHVRKGGIVVAWADVRPWDRKTANAEEPDYSTLDG